MGVEVLALLQWYSVCGIGALSNFNDPNSSAFSIVSNIKCKRLIEVVSKNDFLAKFRAEVGK